MYVIIAGGGRTGTELALMLLEQNHEVRVVEDRRAILNRIHRELPTEVIYEGSPIDVKDLEEAGIRRAQVVAACTASDEDNLIICYLARQLYQVPRTIGRVNDPRKAWLFDPEIFNVDVSLNQPEIMARLIEEEMSLGDMMTLLKLRPRRLFFGGRKANRGIGCHWHPFARSCSAWELRDRCDYPPWQDRRAQWRQRPGGRRRSISRHRSERCQTTG